MDCGHGGQLVVLPWSLDVEEQGARVMWMRTLFYGSPLLGECSWVDFFLGEAQGREARTLLDNVLPCLLPLWSQMVGLTLHCPEERSLAGHHAALVPGVLQEQGEVH